MIIPTDPPANIVQLGVPFKKPVDKEEPFFQRATGCCHFNGPFIVDEKAAEVTCKQCGEKLNPMWVLAQLMNTESRWFQSFHRYQNEMKRLTERSRTKCQHCDQMTRISRS